MTEGLKRTPLYEAHLALGGKMVDFGGWALPVQYSSILDEHRAVRENCGLFDVSHMGELFIKGPEALKLLQRLMTNDFSTLKPCSCRYSPMCYPSGGTVDDVLVYMFNEEKYLLVVNASNTKKDFDWINANADGLNVLVANESERFAEVALQGPCAEEVLAPLCSMALPEKYFSFNSKLTVAGVPAIVSRTGYTGEDGFEVYYEAKYGLDLYNALLDRVQSAGGLPCGLGSRDTLRFEAGMPLYGHELSESITPKEAGLGFAIKLNKEAFIGKEALTAEPSRKRIGLKLLERGIAREQCEVFLNGKLIGITTSGGPAPTLGGNYAMALVDISAKDAKEFEVSVRGRKLKAEAAALPFYKRA